MCFGSVYSTEDILAKLLLKSRALNAVNSKAASIGLEIT
jgi:hypothetical protein